MDEPKLTKLAEDLIQIATQKWRPPEGLTNTQLELHLLRWANQTHACMAATIAISLSRKDNSPTD